jgi:hypothetical protein
MEPPPAALNPPGATVDPIALAMTVGDLFSQRTIDAVEAAPARLRVPLILGSPEFMMR